MFSRKSIAYFGDPRNFERGVGTLSQFFCDFLCKASKLKGESLAQCPPKYELDCLYSKNPFNFTIYMWSDQTLPIFQMNYSEDLFYGRSSAGIVFQVHALDVPTQVQYVGSIIGVGSWANVVLQKVAVRQ